MSEPMTPQHSSLQSYDFTNTSCSAHVIRQRIKSSLQYLFCGDALSMPVHWFYRQSDILKYFPPAGITRMEAAPANHPGAIMNLHSVQRGGRRSHKDGTNNGNAVVGNVILKDKARVWTTEGAHYHHGMPAGENTLNAWVARELLNYLSKEGAYSDSDWLKHYIDFMTAEPPRHPDSYAESYHREFFANLTDGKPLEDCGGITHDTPSMGALVTVPPLAMALLADNPVASVQIICRRHVNYTHPDKGLLAVVDAYVLLLSNLIYRPEDSDGDSYIQDAIKAAAPTEVSPAIDKLLQTNTQDNHVVGRLFSTACYISDSWPSVCYLACKYGHDPDMALLRNTNLGGENAHRGAVLGSIAGLIGQHSPNNLYSQLKAGADLTVEIDNWLDRFYSAEA